MFRLKTKPLKINVEDNVDAINATLNSPTLNYPCHSYPKPNYVYFLSLPYENCVNLGDALSICSSNIATATLVRTFLPPA